MKSMQGLNKWYLSRLRKQAGKDQKKIERINHLQKKLGGNS